MHFWQYVTQNITKVRFKQYQNLFQGIPGLTRYVLKQILGLFETNFGYVLCVLGEIPKNSARKKILRQSQFSKKKAGPARYDNDHRFNGFFMTPSLRRFDRLTISHKICTCTIFCNGAVDRHGKCHFLYTIQILGERNLPQKVRNFWQ